MAFLIVPQVTVMWGGTNLSEYELPNATQAEPLVYNVSVECGSDNQWPTGSMEWNPSGPAFEVYEKLVTSNQDDQIVVTYGYHNYANGPYVQFYFQYGGSTIQWGAEMKVTVSLHCKSSAKSAASRQSVSIDKAEKFKDKGVDMKQMIDDVNKTYSSSPQIKWTQCAEKDATEVKAKRVQFKDQTNGSFNQNVQKQLGNTMLLSNINSPGVQIPYAPYTWESQKGCGSVEQPGRTPDPTKRYGYILGPGIVTSFERKMEYTPPTQDKDPVAAQPSNPPGSKKGGSTESKGLPKDQKEAQQPPKKAVQNQSSPSNVKGVQYSENPNGPQKQVAMNEEEGVKMTADVFMCPAIVGIKPQDIVFIPSLKSGSDLIEDYKVTSVSYKQDGGTVGVSIQGTRSFKLSKPMNPQASQPFLEKAQSLDTLEAWEKYAWRERLGLPG
jgi:hypothetical protein